MGLLSNLFNGDKNAGESAKKLFNDFVDNVQKAVNDEMNGGSQNPSASGTSTASTSYTKTASSSEDESGFSWGPDMPAEENQYNYNGSFTEYFEHIFSAEYPGYSVEREEISRPGAGKKRYTYTFGSGAGKALVVELMSQNCSSKAVRGKCSQEGVPYLRFYYDHDTWWNTREYVVTRINKALGR